MKFDLKWSSFYRILNPFATYGFSSKNSSYFKTRLLDRLMSSERSIDLKAFPPERIRNFSIVAHVDHGKSTLADRLLEITGTIPRDMKNQQVLDKLQVERERGITVKAQTASLLHTYQSDTYLLNLIDTPGHVDFSYEVSRSLAACQGAILLVDANEGVQAQTVANFYLAFSQDLAIVPVLNKIDLKNADPEAVEEQLSTLFEISPDEVIRASAKLGTGVTDVLDAVVERVPPPESLDANAPLKASLIDSWYDQYRGVIVLIAVKQGTIRVGQVGFLTANIRNPREIVLGDTIHHDGVSVEPLAGFRAARPMVFAGAYPLDQSQQPALRSALEKLTLNDASVSVTQESSIALGHGWRLGFLGLLHMEVFNQRLEQEYGTAVVVTSPSVPYKVTLKPQKNIIKKYGGKEEYILKNPAEWPEPYHVQGFEEPMVMGTIITPDRFLGAVTSLCIERRGEQMEARNIDQTRIIMRWKLPLGEIVVDFFDILKSVTSGFATFDYEESGYQPANLVKLQVLLNGRAVEDLSVIVHSSKARETGRQIVGRLKDAIPRQLYEVVLQAAIGSKIVARETIRAVRKDVTAKCYGGDISRKMKLLKKQAEGKKLMKMIGKVQVPRDAFIKVLKR